MADNLIFPIGFDLEKAVKEAEKEGDKALKNLQQIFSRQPLVLKTDTRGFAELLQDTDSLKARLKEVAAQFDKMPTAMKFDLDSEGKVKQLSADGRALWDELMRINTALQGVSMSATQLLRQNQREFDSELKAEQKRQQAIAASLKAEYKRIEAKKQAEAASRRELEMLNRQYAAEERRQRLAASEASIAKRQKVISTLRAEENTIVNITAKLQHWQKVMNSSNMSGKQFKRATEEVQRLSQRLSEAQARIDRLTGRTKEAATATITASAKQSAAVRQVTNEFKSQDGYVSRLIKRLAVYAGFQTISNFLTNIREVTAQFELQRVSLGAIIQDQTKANALFSEIKSFALKSPVSILDLTKYTKQLAAYKIGVDELFETTKKLTDVSVGLGVSLDRVILAYGQTRATGYLRASEIRQFTEMGVPIVEELAAKLSKMNGELVTAAQVMDMVSKRAISFELVKEVFDDMTSAGGMFYNMQEKQGNTLFGLWAKLGDAASVMYDEIGNTDTVNSAMKGTIQLLTDLMKNWREVGRAMGAAAVGFAAIWSVKKVKGWQSNIDAAKIAANEKYIASSNAYRAAIQAEQAARATATAEEYRAIAAKTASAEASYTAARAEYLAARNTTLWSKAWNKLKAAFLGNWVTLLIAAVAAIGTAIYNAHEKANRLKNTLKEIAGESAIEQMKSVRNFESLANVAVNAADGSRKQKEALEELSRTYKDIIPQERLTIENLRDMKGNYDSLTESIKTYVAEQMKQKQVNVILENTGKEMIERTRDFQEAMKDVWNYEQIARFMSVYERILRENPAIVMSEAMEQAAKETGVAWEKISNMGIINKTSVLKALNEFAHAVKEQVTQIDALEVAWNNNYAALGKYGNEYEKLANKIKGNPISVGGSPDIDEDKTPYLFKQQQQNLEILQAMIPTLKKIMSDAGVAWQDGWANIVEAIDTAQPQIISSINFEAINKYLSENLDKLTDEQRKAINKLQEMYYNIGIPDEVVRHNRKIAIDLANSMSEALSKMGDGSRTALDNVTKYFMQSGASVNDYAKTLDDALKDLKARIAELEAVGLLMSPAARKELEDLKTAAEYVEKLRAAISTAVTSGTPRTSTADNRLSQLNEIEQTLTKINQKYEELLKKEGQTKALADIQKIYGDTLKYINQLGEKFKLNFAMPTDFKTLQDYRKAILSVIETLKMKGYEKAAIELQAKIGTGDVDQLSKQIEQKLKELSDKISRTKTAKEFYDKILSQTGDAQIAATLTMNVYGEGGEDLFNNTVKLFQEYFSGVEVDLPINFDTQQIDYKALRKIWEADKALPKDMRKIPEAYDSAIKQMLDSADSSNQKMIEGWLKATEKAKTYSDKLLDLARTTQTEINKITLKKGEAETRITELLGLGALDADQQKELDSLRNFLAIADGLIEDFKAKQAKEETTLAYEAFKDSPMYVQMFGDLEHASTKMLTAMRDRLVTLKDEWKNLDPTQLKEMQQRLREIDEQLTSRNPFKKLVAALKKYRKLRTKGDDLGSKSSAEADDKLIAAQEKLNDEAERYKAILADVNATKEQKDQAQADFNKAESDAKAAQKAKEVWQDVEITIGSATDTILGGLGAIGDIANGVADIMEAVGADEEDVAYWRTIGDSISEITAGLQDIVQSVTKGDLMGVITGVITAIPKMFVGFINIFSAGKIKKANKEIKRQQELLEQLEYTYGRLQKAADKLFGRDYVNNYNQQLKNLQAQAAAYQKQAQAERSKGKKKDKEKIKEYENAYRDTMDEIAEMQADLTAHFTGTTRDDAARQMAKSWVDAKASMSDTFAAIQGDYKDMIKNMIVEGAAARVIENALSPVWDKMDKMLADNNINGAIDALVGGMDDALNAANNGMEVLWKALEARGYDMKQLIGDVDTNYTGIKRDIAGASEETMSNVATIGNTLMYYVSPIPGIAANVALLTQHILNGGAGATTATTAAGWTDWQQQAMDSYNAIQRNTAETVVECRRAAQAAENAVAQLQRVITVKGAKHGFQVYM